uniref:Uncharacterized protein n=1 Tax=Rhizophora mucronata TaxID=61149 RepID=A0A2P2N6M4_RHIMU
MFLRFVFLFHQVVCPIDNGVGRHFHVQVNVASFGPRLLLVDTISRFNNCAHDHCVCSSTIPLTKTNNGPNCSINK